jgi:dTDP-4-amino-4,6-dideoxygalactose transaminase
LDEWNNRRKNIAKLYLSELAEVPDLLLPHVHDRTEPVWHLFVICNAQRDAQQKALLEAGIGTMIHYPIPPHLQPAYANLNLKEGNLPITERLAKEVLSLPIGPSLAIMDAEQIIQIINTNTFKTSNFLL